MTKAKACLQLAVDTDQMNFDAMINMGLLLDVEHSGEANVWYYKAM